MNCPHCHAAVPAGMFREGETQFVRNDFGEVIDCFYIISIFTQCCGAFEVVMDLKGIREIRGPLHGSDERRVLRNLPGRIKDRRAGVVLIPAEVAA